MYYREEHININTSFIDAHLWESVLVSARARCETVRRSAAATATQEASR